MIEMRRGEKFCDPEKGQSPEDMLPKLIFIFRPAQEKILSQIPEDHDCEITAILSPSFGGAAKLPTFLSGMSEDGKVPDFKGNGEALKNWVRFHIGNHYAVTVEPNEAKTKNKAMSITYHSKGDNVPLKQSQPVSKPVAKKGPAVVDEVMPPMDDDDVPF
jgi:hypothetical protein